MKLFKKKAKTRWEILLSECHKGNHPAWEQLRFEVIEVDSKVVFVQKVCAACGQVWLNRKDGKPWQLWDKSEYQKVI